MDNIMKLPEIKNPDKYTSLYVVDFGDHTSVGFTAEEVAELLESETFKNIKVYKIHNARPDGTMELIGVPADRFQLEMGIFFYASDLAAARDDFDRLTSLAVKTSPPCRAKVQLAQLNKSSFVTAFIYPAEYNDEISSWLIDGEYKTAGMAEGGIDAVRRYYETNAKVLDSNQRFSSSSSTSRTGHQLFKAVGMVMQR
jgi:hypothetical protein